MKLKSLLMVCQFGEKNTHNLWYLDMGCSNHTFGDKKAIIELDQSFSDTEVCWSYKVGERGKVSVQTKIMSGKTTLNVLYVLDLKTSWVLVY